MQYPDYLPHPLLVDLAYEAAKRNCKLQVVVDEHYNFIKAVFKSESETGFHSPEKFLEPIVSNI